MPRVVVEKGVIASPGAIARVAFELTPEGAIVETIQHEGVRMLVHYTAAEAERVGVSVLKLAGLAEAVASGQGRKVSPPVRVG